MSKSSEYVRDIGLDRFVQTIKNPNPPPDPKRRGACACGKHIVWYYGMDRVGRNSHARRRCVLRSLATVVTGPRWK